MRPQDSPQSKEQLRAEVQRLSREVADLRSRLADAVMGSENDRLRRNAALNLMEDAILARRIADSVATKLKLEVVERRRAEEALMEADRRKDEFLATLAHELRNPLAPILNSLEILRLSSGVQPVPQPIHEMLERQVCHLVRLVDDLMEVSRVTTGKIELRREPVELASVVRNAIDISRPLIEQFGHRLTVKLPTKPLTVTGDQVRLAQIISNLLNNAAKYTENGGEITLTLERTDAYVVVSVRDTGIGIPEEMLPRVFDLFTQVDRTFPRSQGGLGIGLTLVQTLVQAHGGTVEARSAGPNCGSEFIVRLPHPEQSQSDALGTANEVHGMKAASSCGNRIIVVDDNRDAASSLGTLLQFLGLEVAVFHDGASALEQFSTFSPTAALLDIGMPEMDGYELARRIRSSPGGKEIMLVALTGWGQEEDRRRSKESGFDFHIVKPIELNTLQEILATLPQHDDPPPSKQGISEDPAPSA